MNLLSEKYIINFFIIFIIEKNTNFYLIIHY